MLAEGVIHIRIICSASAIGNRLTRAGQEGNASERTVDDQMVIVVVVIMIVSLQ